MSDSISTTTGGGAGAIRAQPTDSRGNRVKVYVRCRPLNAKETKANQPCAISCDSEAKTVNISYGPTGKKILKAFQFEKVFGMYSTQEEVFDAMVRPIVDETIAGYNCTVFAYGQTGTGKTHTMEGDIHSDENAGLVPRSVKYILELLESSGSDFTIRVSFLELYNENLQDLLNTNSDNKLELRDNAEKGIVCQNLEEIPVRTVADVFSILQRGSQNRQTAATLCNKNSSRSHSIFTMKIMIKECSVTGEEVIRHGQLNLVDLAGSECIGRSGATNKGAEEAGNINKSLLTLGRVIKALVERQSHIPYRESKLTRLLQDSLGGRAKTCMIATLSPSQSAVDESLSTLDYAKRARNIENDPTGPNVKIGARVVIGEYSAEIEELRQQLRLTREKNGIYVDPSKFYGMEERIETLESMLRDCESSLRQRTSENKALVEERDDYKARFDGVEERLREAVSQNEQLTETLEQTRVSLLKTEVSCEEAKAVVMEQAATETVLREQGQCMQEELTVCQGEIEGLLSKVERFSQNQHERLHSTQSMAMKISSVKALVDAELAEFKQQTAAQSEFLRSGVSTILSRSRDTCECLRSSIDEALTTLIGDATAAKDTMVTSCDSLDCHLKATDSHIEEILRGVQQQLSSWLGEVDTAMKSAQEQLLIQQTQLDALTAAISSSADQYAALSSDFSAEQRRQAAVISRAAEALAEELRAGVAAFDLQQQEFSKSTQEALSTKALEIEETMKLQLKELLTQSITGFVASATSTKKFCTRTRGTMDTGFATVASAVELSGSTSLRFTADLAATVATSSSTQVDALREIKRSRTSVDESLNAVSGSVVSQRTHLDDTVTALLGDVHTATAKGCDVVSQTAKTAVTVLQDITAATNRMNTSSGTAIEDFTEFLNGQGQVISSDLHKHFESLSEHMVTQSEHVETMATEVAEFGDAAVAAELKPAGGTPTKRKFGDVPELAATRDRELIECETRLRVIDERDLKALYTQEEIDAAAAAIAAAAVSTLTATTEPANTDGGCDSKRSSNASSGSVADAPLDIENSDPNTLGSSTASSIAAAAAATGLGKETITSRRTRPTRSRSVVAVGAADSGADMKITTRGRAVSNPSATGH